MIVQKATLSNIHSLEIKILTEIIHQIKNVYAECYLVSPQKSHTCMQQWVWCSGECNRPVSDSGMVV